MSSELTDGLFVKCPCCNQTAKVYRVKLRAAHAYALKWLYERAGGTRGVAHYSDAPRAVSRCIHELVYWHLALWHGQAKRDGYYRVTDIGERFLFGRNSVPESVYRYNAMTVGVSKGSLVMIGDIISKKLDMEARLKNGF